MKVIILAAGKGERLYPLTRNTPKSLIDLGNGLSVLETQLQSLQEVGVTDVVVVGGYCVEQIEAKLKRYQYVGDTLIRVIFNPFYEISNNLVSLWFAKQEIVVPGGVIVVNGDDVFKPNVVRSLLDVNEEHEICVTVSQKSTYDDDDMKVTVRHGRVAYISKKIPAGECDAESIGMIRVVGGAQYRLAGKLEQMVRDERHRQAFWLEAFNQLITDGCPAYPHYVERTDWTEIDFHPDLEVVRGQIQRSIIGLNVD